MHEHHFAEMKAKVTGRPAPKRKATKRSKALSVGSTTRDYVAFLCLIEDQAALDVILGQARVELTGALAAYAEAGRRAA
jgi:hypothetical protein